MDTRLTQRKMAESENSSISSTGELTKDGKIYASDLYSKTQVDNLMSSRLRAVRRSVTSSQWACDSVLYLGIHGGNSIVSINTSYGYAVPVTVPDDPMWYAALYRVDGTRITLGTHTLEIIYVYKGIEL